jgi:hypothetical protein
MNCRYLKHKGYSCYYYPTINSVWIYLVVGDDSTLITQIDAPEGNWKVFAANWINDYLGKKEQYEFEKDSIYDNGEMI